MKNSFSCFEGTSLTSWFKIEVFGNSAHFFGVISNLYRNLFNTQYFSVFWISKQFSIFFAKSWKNKQKIMNQTTKFQAIKLAFLIDASWQSDWLEEIINHNFLTLSLASSLYSQLPNGSVYQFSAIVFGKMGPEFSDKIWDNRFAVLKGKLEIFRNFGACLKLVSKFSAGSW